MNILRYCCALLLVWLVLPAAAQVPVPPEAESAAPRSAAEPTLAAQPAEDAPRPTAAVTLDGVDLFRVRGISAMPEDERAARIRERLVAVAELPDYDAERLQMQAESIDRRRFYYGDTHLFTVYGPDAHVEGVSLQLLSETVLARLKEGIAQYRAARAPGQLLRATALLVAITLLAALAVWVLLRLLGTVNLKVEERVKHHFARIEQVSQWTLSRGQLWGWFGGLARATRVLAVVGIALAWLTAALGLYPWTRHFAGQVIHLVIDPLRRLAAGALSTIPDLVFLAVLFVVVRFILRAVRTYFTRVERGWIRLENFDRDWAMPTYRIVRMVIIAFALVVAYPYIPGSDTAAFKGVGLFAGVVLSIGSTSFIANIIAGYSLTYRAAYRVGDWVQIGEHFGEVIEMRSLGTRLRTNRNEEINVPNSLVLNTAVINYSARRRDHSLVLHTEVGIGYDTPWRQVEAMLLEAAARTEGLLAEPAPFVLQKSLGDFTVTYQLNAASDEPGRMGRLYSALHGHIQDVFNEYGVQIMSPNYEADPAAPKVVSPEQFYAAPAVPPTVSTPAVSSREGASAASVSPPKADGAV